MPASGCSARRGDFAAACGRTQGRIYRRDGLFRHGSGPRPRSGAVPRGPDRPPLRVLRRRAHGRRSTATSDPGSQRGPPAPSRDRVRASAGFGSRSSTISQGASLAAAAKRSPRFLLARSANRGSYEARPASADRTSPDPPTRCSTSTSRAMETTRAPNGIVSPVRPWPAPFHCSNAAARPLRTRSGAPVGWRVPRRPRSGRVRRRARVSYPG